MFESIFVRLLCRVRLGSPELILYLLTMMAHQGVFDLAVGLVEEVRSTGDACVPRTFPLAFTQVRAADGPTDRRTQLIQLCTTLYVNVSTVEC